jgi:hypothetical protein
MLRAQDSLSSPLGKADNRPCPQQLAAGGNCSADVSLDQPVFESSHCITGSWPRLLGPCVSHTAGCQYTAQLLLQSEGGACVGSCWQHGDRVSTAAASSRMCCARHIACQLTAVIVAAMFACRARTHGCLCTRMTLQVSSAAAAGRRGRKVGPRCKQLRTCPCQSGTSHCHFQAGFSTWLLHQVLSAPVCQCDTCMTQPLLPHELMCTTQTVCLNSS